MTTINQKGASLVGVLIGFALLGILVGGTVSLLSTLNRYVLDHVRNGETDDLRRYVMASLDCERTAATALKANKCDGTTFVDLKGDTCSALSPISAGSAGSFELRAICSQTPPASTNLFELTIDFRRLDRAGRAFLDPMSRQPSDWAKLFEGVPIACKAPPPGSGEIVFTWRYAIDWFVQGVRTKTRPDFPYLGVGWHAHNDADTANAICSLADCSAHSGRKNRKFKSPGDDHLFRWNASKSNFQVIPAKGNNNYLNGLTCSGCETGGVMPCSP